MCLEVAIPIPITWTDAMDDLLLAMQSDGAHWNEIASALKVGRSAAIERGRRLGLAPRRLGNAVPDYAPPSRERTPEPLPAMHVISWGVLTRLTPSLGA